MPTALLGLSYLVSAQSQPEVVVNSDLDLLDGFVLKRTGDVGSGNFTFSKTPDASTQHGVINLGAGGFAGAGGAFAGSATGTLLAVNAVTGATYNSFDFQSNGVSVFNMAPTGAVTLAPTSGRPLTINHTAAFAGASILINPPAGTQRAFIKFANSFQWLTDSAFNGTGDFLAQNVSSGNAVLTCSTADLIILGSAAAGGGAVLGKSGGKIGFFDATPALKSSAYTITNPTTNRSLNETTATLAQVAQVLGTLLADLQAYGLIA